MIYLFGGFCVSVSGGMGMMTGEALMALAAASAVSKMAWLI